MQGVSLDGWIGKQVAVQYTPSEVDGDQQTSAMCTLTGVDDRGIILGYHDSEDLRENFYFLPWRRIEWIHLPPE